MGAVWVILAALAAVWGATCGALAGLVWHHRRQLAKEQPASVSDEDYMFADTFPEVWTIDYEEKHRR